MEYWIIYHLASGEPLVRGSGHPGTSAFQPLPEGAAIVVVPMKVVAQPELDLDALRAGLAAQVDAAAATLRASFLTPGAPYAAKEAEARAWLADRSVATPFLSAEADSCGIDLEELATRVVSRAEACAATEAQIEGARRGAKTAIMDAGTFGAIVAAAKLGWEG